MLFLRERERWGDVKRESAEETFFWFGFCGRPFHSLLGFHWKKTHISVFSSCSIIPIWGGVKTSGTFFQSSNSSSSVWWARETSFPHRTQQLLPCQHGVNNWVTPAHFVGKGIGRWWKPKAEIVCQERRACMWLVWVHRVQTGRIQENMWMDRTGGSTSEVIAFKAVLLSHTQHKVLMACTSQTMEYISKPRWCVSSSRFHFQFYL